MFWDSRLEPQITSDIELSGAGCTTAITPNQLVQSSSENDIWYLS
ncbi:NTP-binding protein [Enterobacter cloacae]|nr:NTP-binding protein [Enterobacter cloacae]